MESVMYATCPICTFGKIMELGEEVPCDVCKGSGRISRSVEGMAEEIIQLRSDLALLYEGILAQVAGVITTPIEGYSAPESAIRAVKALRDVLDAEREKVKRLEAVAEAAEALFKADAWAGTPMDNLRNNLRAAGYEV